jgi:hypothetical protein
VLFCAPAKKGAAKITNMIKTFFMTKNYFWFLNTCQSNGRILGCGNKLVEKHR